MEVPPASHTPAHESAVTVAPFRAWRGSLPIIARGPTRDTIKLTGNTTGQPTMVNGLLIISKPTRQTRRIMWKSPVGINTLGSKNQGDRETGVTWKRFSLNSSTTLPSPSR